MNNLTPAAQTIKDTISAVDAATMLGLEIRHGRCRCPIHGGTDFNCVLYKGDRGYYCHVCKSGGDVISFVRGYFKFGFRDAIAWFNSAFKLGLDLDGPTDPEAVRRAQEAQVRRKNEREAREREERAKFDAALDALDRVRGLEEQRDKYVPRSAWEEWTDPFSEAVEQLNEANRTARELYYECMEVRKDG